jgi:HKD family nuclease
MDNCQPVPPNSKSLNIVLENAIELDIYTPFYTAAGLLLLEDFIGRDHCKIKKLNFSCRITKAAWIQNSIDPISLRKFIDKFSNCLEINIAHNDTLHAKGYFAENNGLIGSANLTSQGFGDGLEFLYSISGSILTKTKSWFNGKIKPLLHPITPAELNSFIGKNINAVIQLQKKYRKLLRQSHKHRGNKAPISSIDVFMDYCAKLQGAVPNEVVLRYLGKFQLSGHIRNFYYASQQFLSKYPGLISPIRKEPMDEFHLQNSPYIELWKKFINSPFLKDIEEERYSAKSTAIYLPTNLGGKQISGGAGSGNINRVLPLVARFLCE